MSPIRGSKNSVRNTTGIVKPEIYLNELGFKNIIGHSVNRQHNINRVDNSRFPENIEQKTRRDQQDDG